jgi:hypothetical protein
MDNPLRHGWSKLLGRLGLPGLREDWEILWARLENLPKRLVDALTELGPLPPTAGHHTHYCEDCDRHWVHAGHVCAIAWAAPCADGRHESDAATAGPRLGRWLVVVRRERSGLCQQLHESFGDNPRITVVVDRRRCERRRPPVLGAPLRTERRHGSDRRTPATDGDGHVWDTLGFRPHRVRS